MASVNPFVGPRVVPSEMTVAGAATDAPPSADDVADGTQIVVAGFVVAALLFLFLFQRGGLRGVVTVGASIT